MTAYDILDRLLGEWGANPAFERDQITKALSDLKGLIEGCVPDKRTPGSEGSVSVTAIGRASRAGYNQAREETLRAIKEVFGE